jgi:hypothetical protein
MSNNLLTENLSAPLNGATAANLEIDTGMGNLTVDELVENTQVLASGALQYFEKQGRPTELFSSEDGKNPSVSSEISAHTGGGNVRLNLPDMALTGLSADTGGGNMDMILPEHAADLRVRARTGGGNISIEVGDTITGSNTVEANSGAGNVVVEIPPGIAARVDASTGLGKVLMEPRLSRIGAHLYQSADYEDAADKIEIAVHSGAGNVSVTTK